MSCDKLIWKMVYAILLFMLLVQVSPLALAATVPPAQGPHLTVSIPTKGCRSNQIDERCDDQYFPDNAFEFEQRYSLFDRVDRKEVEVAKKMTDKWSKKQPDETLRQVLILHRHGDRTPVVFPPKDPLVAEPFWAIHGPGQLTNRGKQRLAILGRMIRERYNSFLNGSVNKNQRISRASGSLRCIESAQTFLSTFLGLDTPQNSDAKQLIWGDSTLAHLWQPVNVQAPPAKIDGMLAESAECKALTDEYMNVIDKSNLVKNIFTEYKHEAEVLERLYGYEMDHFYKWFWAGSQVEVERSYFEDKILPEILQIYDRLEDAGNKAFSAYQMTLKARRLRGGLLINDMIKNMKSFSNMAAVVPSESTDLKKFIHYSAHDLTIVVMLGILESWDKFGIRPDYASNIILELHEDSGEWFVRFFYMPKVPAEHIELHLTDCETNNPKGRCTLTRFEEVMKPYMIENWQTWMKECKNDLYKMDPYSPGS